MNVFKHRPLALCCAIFVCVYFICSCLPLFGSSHKTEGEEYTEFEVRDITYQNESIAYLDAVASDGCKYHFTVYSPGEVRVGDVLGGVCSFKPIESSDDFDSVRYYRSKGIYAEAEVTSPDKIDYNNNVFRDAIDGIRSYCVNTFDRYTDEDTSALLSALTIGDKSALDDSLKRDFTRTGLSHMLAISGMHLSVIMGCITMFADVFDLGKRTSAIVVIVLCVSFMFVAGMSSSVLRAGLMFVIISAGDLFGRRSDSLTNLLVAVTLILIFSPSAIYDAGLILSFTATLGIIVIVGYYMRKINRKKNGFVKKLFNCLVISVLTTIAAQAFSFIPLLFFFDSFSVISVLSNLLLSPVLTVMLFAIPIFLAVSFIPFAAVAAGAVMNVVTDVIILLVTLLSSIPDALVSLNYDFVPYTYIAVALGAVLTVVIRKRFSYIMPFLCWFLCFVLAFVGYNINYGSSADLIFYSEAGSDAVFIRNRYGSIYLDLGKGSDASEDRAFDMVEENTFTNELDCWVVTHYTNNIVYAMADYFEEFYIRNIYIPIPTDAFGKAAASELEHYAEKENVELTYYVYGDSFSVNGVEMSVHIPIIFEDSSVFIPSADIKYNGENVTYYGLGYFDYGEYDAEYDLLYIGECGTKRKQITSPVIKAERLIVAENNDVATSNITGERIGLGDEVSFCKIRIG